jgi:NADH:ubiquinone oxidoreductase subunit E
MFFLNCLFFYSQFPQKPEKFIAHLEACASLKCAILFSGFCGISV